MRLERKSRWQKWLVIGGTGLISTAIVNQLVERGDEVVVYNRGKTEVRIPLTVRRVIGDRRDYAHFEKQVQELGTFDAVIDMVCYVPDAVEGVRRTIRWLEERERIEDCANDPLYDRLLELWEQAGSG